MADDLTKQAPCDLSRVNVSEPWECGYWYRHFGCTEDELRAAVETVGPLVDKVREHLENKKPRA